MHKRRLYSDQETEALYKRWLSNESLRAIARTLPLDRAMSHNSLKRLFAAKYGPHATNIKKTSLARSLISDYGNKPDIVAFALSQAGVAENQYHRSAHSVDQLTIFQVQRNEAVLDIATSLAAVDAEPSDEPLNLRFFVYFSEQLSQVLKTTLSNAIQREVAQDLLTCVNAPASDHLTGLPIAA